MVGFPYSQRATLAEFPPDASIMAISCIFCSTNVHTHIPSPRSSTSYKMLSKVLMLTLPQYFSFLSHFFFIDWVGGEEKRLDREGKMEKQKIDVDLKDICMALLVPHVPDTSGHLPVV